MRYSVDPADLENIWQQASSCLAELNDARLFITGGTGFFGTWLLESLYFAKIKLGLRIQVVVLSRNPSLFLEKMPHFKQMPGLEWILGDVTSFSYPQKEFTHVIHAATEASAQLNQEQPLLMFDTITQGTRRVLQFSVQTKIQKFLLVSSGAVYGEQPLLLTHVDETYLGASNPLNPMSAYGLGKRMAEYLCTVYANQYQFQMKVARCFAFVGPHLPLTTHFAIGNFIHNAIHGQPIRVQGDGKAYRSYLYAADLMVWLWTILCHGESTRAYNVGSEQAISIAELAHLIAQDTDNLSVSIMQPNNTASASYYVPSTQRAQKELGLSQTTSLANSIQRTIQWNRRNDPAKIK
jgi:nucleoside-diphosphate-sugar epimerase